MQRDMECTLLPTEDSNRRTQTTTSQLVPRNLTPDDQFSQKLVRVWALKGIKQWRHQLLLRYSFSKEIKQNLEFQRVEIIQSGVMKEVQANYFEPQEPTIVQTGKKTGIRYFHIGTIIANQLQTYGSISCYIKVSDSTTSYKCPTWPSSTAAKSPFRIHYL